MTFTQTNMKHQKSHVCVFSRKNNVLDSLYPPNKTFSKIKRKFRESLLISEENGRKCFTRKGKSGYIYEKETHLTQYFYTIHPYSKFRQYWEIFAVIEIFFSIIIRTFVCSFCENLSNYKYQIPSILDDLFATTDALLLFLVGYRDKETQEIVLENRKICLKYIQEFYFYVNFIASFPFEFCIYLYSISVGQPAVIFKYVAFLKILKLLTAARYIRHTSKIYNWSDVFNIVAWAILCQIFFCHWLSCLFHVILYDAGNVFRSSVSRTYVSDGYDCFYHHLKIFFILISLMFKRNGFFKEHPIDFISGKLFWFIAVVLVYFTNIVLAGFLIQYFALIKTSDVFYEEMKQEVQTFLAQDNLPKRIHKKVLKYLEFRYRHTYFFEKVILETLSPPLKREVANFLCYNLLVHPNSLLTGIPEEKVTDLCLLMKYEIFLPGDIIFKAGGKALKLYALYSGSVAVFSEKSQEIMHWYEGQQFGASAFIGNTLHPVTAIALEMSECYSLRYSDFLKTFADSPNYIKMVNKAALIRRQYVMNLYTEE